MNSNLSMAPMFFDSPASFRHWLEANHQSETELIVGYYKVNTKKPSMSWSQSVDEAICFGWIDGIRRSVNEDSYCIRFTPRNPKSNWSAVNIKKVEEMIRLGKMTSAGLAAFERRSNARSALYSYENHPEKLDSELEIQFQEHQKAWTFFNSQAPSYQKTRIYWVISAKQEATKQQRLAKLIGASEAGKRLF
jgi:uncharacterized protein YdeI (YjbR/CyaY-like superfamily)